MNATKQGTNLSTIEHLDFEHTPRCESLLCQNEFHRGSHAADWLVGYNKCGHTPYWCNARFMYYNRRLLHENIPIWCFCGVHMQEIKWWKPVRIS